MNDIATISCAGRRFANSNQLLAFRAPNQQVRRLEGEIHTCADHAEIVLRPIHKIPAEVTDPADMRGEADFHAAADLPDRPRLTVGVKIREDVGVFTIRKRISFAPAEDRTASAKKVR